MLMRRDVQPLRVPTAELNKVRMTQSMIKSQQDRHLNVVGISENVRPHSKHSG